MNYLVGSSDCAEFHAQIPAQSSPGESGGKLTVPTNISCRLGLQNIRLLRDHIHRSNSLPESAGELKHLWFYFRFKKGKKIQCEYENYMCSAWQG